jgi:hypothetical protein
MSVIRWEEPPPHGNNKPKRPSKYQPIADALRARPGKWAVVLEDTPTGSCGTFAFKVRTGYGPFAPERSFEAKTVGPAAGRSAKVYARYVGDEVSA